MVAVANSARRDGNAWRRPAATVSRAALVRQKVIQGSADTPARPSATPPTNDPPPIAAVYALVCSDETSSALSGPAAPMSAVWIRVGAPPKPRPQAPMAHTATAGWSVHRVRVSIAMAMSAIAHSSTGRGWRSQQLGKQRDGGAPGRGHQGRQREWRPSRTRPLRPGRTRHGTMVEPSH